MARKANLTLDGAAFSTAFVKLDRKKVYGWSKIDIYDEGDSLCSLASIADGEHILPSGSVTLASFNTKGEYVEKSTLVGLDSNGKKVDKKPSIYDEQNLGNKFIALQRKMMDNGWKLKTDEKLYYFVHQMRRILRISLRRI